MIIHLPGLELPINLIFHLAAFVILQNIAGKIYDRYISQLNNINKLVITQITHIYTDKRHLQEDPGRDAQWRPSNRHQYQDYQPCESRDEDSNRLTGGV